MKMDFVQGSSLDNLSNLTRTYEDKLRDFEMDFVFAVEDKLDELGISRADLADKLGCTESEVSRILSGSENISLETMAKFSAVLGLDIHFTSKPAEESQFADLQGSPQ